MEPDFRAMEIAVGGAVIAINHTGYVDFPPAALAATQRKRRMRFPVDPTPVEAKALDEAESAERARRRTEIK